MTSGSAKLYRPRKFRCSYPNGDKRAVSSSLA